VPARARRARSEPAASQAATPSAAPRPFSTQSITDGVRPGSQRCRFSIAWLSALAASMPSSAARRRCAGLAPGSTSAAAAAAPIGR